MIDISKLDVMKDGAIIFLDDDNVIQRRVRVKQNKSVVSYKGNLHEVVYKNKRFNLGQIVK